MSDTQEDAEVPVSAANDVDTSESVGPPRKTVTMTYTPKEQPRVAVEDLIADRIALLRQRRGWTYKQLSVHMARWGCPMDASSLQKIEKGTPRRKISVNELMVFARVFSISLVDLIETSSKDSETTNLSPSETMTLIRGSGGGDLEGIWKVFEAAKMHRETILDLQESYERLVTVVQSALDTTDGLRPRMEAFLGTEMERAEQRARYRFGDEDEMPASGADWDKAVEDETNSSISTARDVLDPDRARPNWNQPWKGNNEP
ncbi:helix-turn-helix domain-containing protein [Paenarthrobacter ureafaciens]|uniref:helix-turn-helix domain-containing protein n=1 Tax=Paenarthrobacter ureafaciens TaxID=37931 RepID=UPI00140B224A|nr:helix-turn-helix transcriptional regulator [Paenarthrobacter ureafaciens]MCX8454681.1 helix-turn-helix transcriptional regulator [Paenarthrobacter ureafaciens]MCY0974174.1 helix-turn-helix transcriptional regulator [Paenarthrobacter ureafaciens]